MARITFEPPATETQWRSICAMFGTCEPQWVIDTDNHDEHETRVVASVTTNSWPCDVTIYPGSPKTWARAVYEAGVHEGYCKARGCRVSKSVSLGGVTQQPFAPPIRKYWVDGKKEGCGTAGGCYEAFDGADAASIYRAKFPGYMVTEIRPVTPS